MNKRFLHLLPNVFILLHLIINLFIESFIYFQTFRSVSNVLNPCFYCEGAAAACSGCVSAVSSHLDAGLQRPEPPLLQQPQPTERHTASAASAWLEPQRLPVRSLRLPPAWNFSQDFQIQAPPQQHESTRVGVRACVRASHLSR